MRTITAEEIKRRGIVAVEPLISEGAVHILVRDEPKYVVLTEERYAEMIEELNEAYIARVLAAEAEIAAGRGHRYATVEEHMAAIDAIDEDNEKPT